MSGPLVYKNGRREFVQLVLRMPPEMLEHIDRAAAAGWRSRTSELLRRLSETMEGESFDAHGCIVKQAPALGNAVGETPKVGQ